MPSSCDRAREGSGMNGKYVGYVAGEDPLYRFLSKIMRDRLEVREPQLAYRVFRLSGSNEVYAYEEKFSGAKSSASSTVRGSRRIWTRLPGWHARSTRGSRR